MKENQSINMFEQALDLLKSAKTVEDLRNIGDRFVEIQVGALRAHLDSLKRVNQMPIAEKTKEFEAVTESSNQLQVMMDKMMEEAQRFDELKGGNDLINELGDRAQELSGSIMEEVEEQMNLLMDSMMGS